MRCFEYVLPTEEDLAVKASAKGVEQGQEKNDANTDVNLAPLSAFYLIVFFEFLQLFALIKSCETNNDCHDNKGRMKVAPIHV